MAGFAICLYFFYTDDIVSKYNEVSSACHAIVVNLWDRGK